jgi:hypothetical protein
MSLRFCRVVEPYELLREAASMRILAIVFLAALVGLSVGGAAAYIQVRVDPDAGSLPPGTAGMQPPADDNEPRALVDEPHFNFGTMQRGTSKSHEFVIKNVGKSPLRLEVGQTSCKCTLGDVTGRPIPPGESTHVRVEWAAKTDQGPFRQTATVLTNDPLNSQIELTIEGEILETSGVVPPELMFDKLPVGESKSAEVYVMAMLQDNLDVRDAELSNVATRDKFDVRIEPVEREKLPSSSAKDGVRITVTAKPGLPVGRFDQWLSLRTNLADAEKLEIPLVGRVVGDITVHGIGWQEDIGVLVMGRVKSSEGRKAKLNVVVRGQDAAGVKFTVQSVDPPELKVTIGDPKQLRPTLLHVPVEIEVPAGTRPMVRLDTAQGDEARIVLKTTHPTISELVLGVRFSVER